MSLVAYASETNKNVNINSLVVLCQAKLRGCLTRAVLIPPKISLLKSRHSNKYSSIFFPQNRGMEHFKAPFPEKCSLLLRVLDTDDVKRNVSFIKEPYKKEYLTLRLKIMPIE